MNEVTINVPATSANLGPGYDSLGVALQIHNQVTVRRGGPSQTHVMAADAAARFFNAARTEPFAFHWEIKGEVPQSRGLGSSVTVRLGLLHGLNELTGKPLSREHLFELCAQLEGHPDNAAPAEFGGFTVAKSGLPSLRCEVSPELHFVLLVPGFEIATPAARAVLPEMIDHKKAAASSANACRITAAFALQRYELLRGCFEDFFHQPYREPLIPMLPRVIAAGEKAGALGGFLSGSGSTICCLTLENPEAVTAAMLSAADGEARTILTQADNTGATRL
ncbi:MAG: Homoserine kinase [Chthoniobacteraceae bacterium]|nr:Homoserine kinase [Chthoniobacteraceae bacterium]